MARGAWLGLAMLVAAGGGSAVADEGAALFADRCSACHQLNGQGTPNLAPPLVSPVIKRAARAEAADYTARVVLNGLSGPIAIDGQKFLSAMPAQGQLGDGEIAAIVAHVLVDLNGIAAEGAGLPGAAAVTALRRAPVGHGELRRLRAGFAN